MFADYVAPWLIRGLGSSLRIHQIDAHNIEAARDERGHLLFACLHGRMFLPVWHHRKEHATTLVSQSRDGEIVARLVHRIGHNTVRGSSTRGGREGLRAMVEAGKSNSIAMMVDGPRGPREDPKMGTIALARLTGMSILPTVGSASASWEFGSWDAFQLPKPYSRGFILYGEPLVVAKSTKGEEAMEQVRLELKRRLIELRKRADRIASGEEEG